MRQVKLLDIFCGTGESATGYMQAASALDISLTIIGIDSIVQPGYPCSFLQEDDPVRHLQHFYKQYHFVHCSRPDRICRDLLYQLGSIGVIMGHSYKTTRPDVYLSADMFNQVGKPCLVECVNWFCFRPALPATLNLKRSYPLLPIYTRYIGLQMLNLKFPLYE